MRGCWDWDFALTGNKSQMSCLVRSSSRIFEIVQLGLGVFPPADTCRLLQLSMTCSLNSGLVTTRFDNSIDVVIYLFLHDQLNDSINAAATHNNNAIIKWPSWIMNGDNEDDIWLNINSWVCWYLAHISFASVFSIPFMCLHMTQHKVFCNEGYYGCDSMWAMTWVFK